MDDAQVGPKEPSELLGAIEGLEKSISILEEKTAPVRVSRGGEKNDEPERSSVLTRLELAIDRIIRVNNELEI